MRFLDADLQPVSPRRVVAPLLLAAAITAAACVSAWLAGHAPSVMLQAFPAVFTGALMAMAGISPQRSPLASLAALPLLWLMLVAGARLASAFFA